MNVMSEEQAKKRFAKKVNWTIYKIVITYGLFGMLWVAFYDTATYITQGSNIEHAVYVAITSILLYFLLARYLNQDVVAEEKRKESEEVFKKFFEFGPTLNSINNLDTGVFLNVNEQFLKTFGYSRNEVLGHTSKELNLFKDYSQRQKAFKDLATKGYIKDVVVEVNRKTGETRTASLNIQLMDVAGEKLMFFQAADVSEQKRYEKELKASEEKYRSIVEMSPTPMHLYKLKDERELIFIGSNPAADKVLGIDHSKLIGYSIESAFPGLVETEIPTLYKNIARGDVGPQIFETPYEDNTISGVFEVHVFRTGPGLISVNFFDISDKKAMEKVHNLAQLGQIVSGVAHEMRNPLEIISGNAELSLLKISDKEEVKRNLKVIVDECKLSSEIIDRMLKFSKPSKNEYCDVEVNDMLDRIIRLIEHQYLLKNIKIIKHYSSNLPTLHVDERQMQEVFMNIMNNAVDAMPNGGAISVYTTFDGKYIHIDFSDTGIGIPAGEIDKLFEPFYTTKSKGTGLGLSITNSIVKDHGGSLKIQSQLGSGTTITVFLPKGGADA